FSVLFPEEKVTCRGIHEFLGKSLNYQTVQRRLSTYFVKKGDASQSHYIVTGYDLKKILVEANYDSAYEQDIEYMSEKRRNTFRKYLFMSDDSNSVLGALYLNSGITSTKRDRVREMRGLHLRNGIVYVKGGGSHPRNGTVYAIEASHIYETGSCT